MDKIDTQNSNDTNDKIIEITTANGNKIRLNDESHEIIISDVNGNFIQMNRYGIHLQSQNDISLNSDRNIIITANNIELKGEQSVNISGGAVDLKGQQTLTAYGNIQTTIDSSGQTNVKGTMVNIN